MRRSFLVATFVVSIMTGAHAAEGVVRLSDGRAIETPPVSEMDCDTLSAKLSEIDATGYRGVSPTPRNPADRPLLAYEEEAATVFYQNCVVRALGRDTPRDLFNKGYREKN